MAALARSLRPAMRLLSSGRPVLTTKRGYADEMSFTFAAANQVRNYFYAVVYSFKIACYLLPGLDLNWAVCIFVGLLCWG